MNSHNFENSNCSLKHWKALHLRSGKGLGRGGEGPRRSGGSGKLGPCILLRLRYVCPYFFMGARPREKSVAANLEDLVFWYVCWRIDTGVCVGLQVHMIT